MRGSGTSTKSWSEETDRRPTADPRAAGLTVLVFSDGQTCTRRAQVCRRVRCMPCAIVVKRLASSRPYIALMDFTTLKSHTQSQGQAPNHSYSESSQGKVCILRNILGSNKRGRLCKCQPYIYVHVPCAQWHTCGTMGAVGLASDTSSSPRRSPRLCRI